MVNANANATVETNCQMVSIQKNDASQGAGKGKLKALKSAAVTLKKQRRKQAWKLSAGQDK